MGKYNDWTRGEDEALLNILGGTDVARAVLRGERKLAVEEYTGLENSDSAFMNKMVYRNDP